MPEPNSFKLRPLLAGVGNINPQLCFFLCLQPLVQHGEALFGLHTWGSAFVGQHVSAAMPHGSTPLNPSLPAYSSSKYVCPIVTSTAWRAAKQAK